jgi:hypothetical protein
MEHGGWKKYLTNYGLVHPRLSYLHQEFHMDLNLHMDVVFKNISNALVV